MPKKTRLWIYVPSLVLHNLWKYLVPLSLIPAAAYGVYRYNIQLYVDEIRQKGELVILTRNAPTTYYETKDNQFAGLEYDMVRAFTDALGVKARFVVKDSVHDIFATINDGQADFAAAGLAATDERRKLYRFGPSYQSVQTLVICRRGQEALPTSLGNFNGRELWVPERSVYAETLERIGPSIPGLHWNRTKEWNTELLLAKVWQRELDCTVANSDIFALNQRYYPELQAAFPIVSEQRLAWVVNPQHWQLEAILDDWFTKFKHQGKLDELVARYYGYLDEFDYVDTRKFQRRIEDLLPRYHNWFRQAAGKNKLDWRLLAALSYQESHWNPRARSPTGVRGIMMLTLPTARYLGVKSRLDPKPNIFAGARHFAELRNNLPGTIAEPDRTWMALAAYNMGPGHLYDALELAVKLNKNPDSWNEVEAILPLLSEENYYANLKHGYAGGTQAMHYVRRIRDYQDMLTQYLQQNSPEKLAQREL